MCGISGFLHPGGFEPAAARALAEAMASTLVHRGPDDAGVWLQSDAGIALAHRRLAVLDLTPAGHQPMTSASGRFVIVFNGEIYNHLQVRSQLPERHWRGRSDTETLLAAIEQWGIAATMRQLVGMFAFAIWDRASHSLTLGRDRLGEKPLYYGWHSGVFLFGSELKALRRHPAFVAQLDLVAMDGLFRRGYIAAPRSMIRGIHKLLPGTTVDVGKAEQEAKSDPTPTPYWSLAEASERGESNPFGGSDGEAVDELDRLIATAIRQQRVADVPLGAFLSGGVDSSVVVALMQAHASEPVRTFTIGFAESEFDESVHALAVARHFGTRHEQIRLTDDDAMALLPRMGAIYDEPLGDVSQLPTFLVSELARKHVTVALSGDGGDELFGGYAHYLNVERLWRRLGANSRPLRRLVVRLADAMPGALLDGLLVPIISMRGKSPSIPPRERVATVIDGLRSNSDLDFYRSMLTQWRSSPVLNGSSSSVDDMSGVRPPPGGSFIERMMYCDALTYLPDDILTKVDRAAMSVSLETRVPLLDHRIVEFAGRLPLRLKIHDGRGKWILRQVLQRYLPQALFDRPKMGFSVPMNRWLRTPPIRDWAEALLAEDRIRVEGHLDASVVRERWRQHLSGRCDWQSSLWTVLMFQAWLEEMRSQAHPTTSNCGRVASS